MKTEAKTANGRYYEYVIDNIKGMIIRGELKQGEKIPSERELAERFNVSRVPIREALKILEYMGILDSTQGDGTYVRNFTVPDLVERMNFAVTGTADTIMDLLELRIDLECFAAYHAALRRTDEDIAQFRKALLDMREAKRNSTPDDETIARLRQLSHQFHRCLVQAAHNAVLTSVYENLYELLDISNLAHEAIFNRIIQQDAEGARQSMKEHLSEVRVKLNATLADAEAAELSQAHSVG